MCEAGFFSASQDAGIEPRVNLFHIHVTVPDAVLGLNLKSMCLSRQWAYQSVGPQTRSRTEIGVEDIVVLDFFTHPIRSIEVLDGMTNLQNKIGAASLIVFPRRFAPNAQMVAHSSFEYCFLGCDGDDEIKFRIDLARAKAQNLLDASSAGHFLVLSAMRYRVGPEEPRQPA